MNTNSTYEPSLVCSKGNPASIICTQQGCTSPPVMCKEENCDCLTSHAKHSHIRSRVFIERIKEPLLPKDIKELEDGMTSLINMMIEQMTSLKQRHQKLMKIFLDRRFKFHELRTQILAKDQPVGEGFTGDSAGKMVEQLEKSQKLHSPYQTSVAQLQQTMKSIDAELYFIVQRVELFWNFEYPVHLRTVHGKCETFFLEPTLTVEMLKSRIHSREGLPVDQIRLSFNGKQLDGKKTLRDSNIQLDADVYIGLKYRGVFTIFVNGEGGKNLTLKVQSNDLVDKIRTKIQQREGIPLQQQRLVFKGVVMENGRCLGDYHIKNESELELTVVTDK